MSFIPQEDCDGSLHRDHITMAQNKQVRFRGDIHLVNGTGKKVKIASIPAAPVSQPKILGYNPATGEVFHQTPPTGDGGADITIIEGQIDALESTVGQHTIELADKIGSTQFSGLQTQVNMLSTDVTNQNTALMQKADSSSLNTLSGTVAGLSATVSSQSNALLNKANLSDLSALGTTVSGLQQSVSTLSSSVTNKADQSSVTALYTAVGTLSSSVSALQSAATSSTVAQEISDLQAQDVATQATIATLQSTLADHTSTLQSVATQNDTAMLTQGLNDLTTALGAKAAQSDLSALQATVGTKVSAISSGNANITVSAANPANPVITLAPDLTATTLTVSRTNGVSNQNSNIVKIGSQNRILEFFPYFSTKAQQSGSMLTSDYALLVSDNGGSQNVNSTLFIGSWNNNGGMHIAQNGDLYIHGQTYLTHQYTKKFVLRNTKVTLLTQGLDGTLTGGAAAPKHSLEAWVDATSKRLTFQWNNVSPRIFYGHCTATVNGTITTATINAQTFSSTQLTSYTPFTTITVGNMTSMTVCLFNDTGTEAYEIKAYVLSPGSATIKDYISIEKLI